MSCAIRAWHCESVHYSLRMFTGIEWTNLSSLPVDGNASSCAQQFSISYTNYTSQLQPHTCRRSEWRQVRPCLCWTEDWTEDWTENLCEFCVLKSSKSIRNRKAEGSACTGTPGRRWQPDVRAQVPVDVFIVKVSQSLSWAISSQDILKTPLVWYGWHVEIDHLITTQSLGDVAWHLNAWIHIVIHIVSCSISPAQILRSKVFGWTDHFVCPSCLAMTFISFVTVRKEMLHTFFKAFLLAFNTCLMLHSTWELWGSRVYEINSTFARAQADPRLCSICSISSESSGQGQQSAIDSRQWRILRWCRGIFKHVYCERMAEMYSFYQLFTSSLQVDSSSCLLFVSSFTLLNLVPQIFGWEWSYGEHGACFSEGVGSQNIWTWSPVNPRCDSHRFFAVCVKRG